ncbi:hypothetical protein HK098_007321 [Nowakowskiella sp. JEL0407]|nr:hypothetical protein HK098_007321 [Nowakowskiella sp. JEL0407]
MKSPHTAQYDITPDIPLNTSSFTSYQSTISEISQVQQSRTFSIIRDLMRPLTNLRKFVGLYPQARVTLLKTSFKLSDASIYGFDEQPVAVNLKMEQISLLVNADTREVIDEVGFSSMFNSTLKIATTLTINDIIADVSLHKPIAPDFSNEWEVVSIPSVLFTTRCELVIPHPQSIAPRLVVHLISDLQISNPSLNFALQVLPSLIKLYLNTKNVMNERGNSREQSGNGILLTPKMKIDRFFNFFAVHESSVNLSFAIANPSVSFSALSYIPKKNANISIRAAMFSATLKSLSDEEAPDINYVPPKLMDISLSELCMCVSHGELESPSSLLPLNRKSTINPSQTFPKLLEIDSIKFQSTISIIPPSAFEDTRGIELYILEGLTVDFTSSLSIRNIVVDAALLSAPLEICPKFDELVSSLAFHAEKIKEAARRPNETNSAMTRVQTSSTSLIAQLTVACDISLSKISVRGAEPNRKGGTLLVSSNLTSSFVMSKASASNLMAWTMQTLIPKISIHTSVNGIPSRTNISTDSSKLLELCNITINRDPVINVEVSTMTLDFDITKYLIVASSLLPILKFKPKNSPMNVPAPPDIKLPPATIVFNLVKINTTLPQNVLIFIRLDRVTLSTLTDVVGASAKVPRISVEVLVDESPPRIAPTLAVWEGKSDNEITKIRREILVIEEAKLRAVLKTAVDVSGFVQTLAVTIPYSFELANVLENTVNTVKALKVINKSILNGKFPNPQNGVNLDSSILDLGNVEPDYDGKTTIDSSKIPRMELKVETFSLKMEESPFEISLNRSLMWGLEEQRNRIARDKAFQKRAKELRMKRSKSLKDEGVFDLDETTLNELEAIWWTFQEFNSTCWLNFIKKRCGGNLCYCGEDPPICLTNISHLEIVVEAPDLLADTVEKSLNVLDPQTAPDIIYDQLIPRKVTLQFTEAIMRLKDYKSPFFHIKSNESGSSPTWKTEGLLVLAEKLAGHESQREILIPLQKDGTSWLPTIKVTRTINPPKIYSLTETQICDGVHAKFNWGVALEGAVGDMVRVIETFTLNSVDPSAPIGWWDKMRLMVHGHNTITVGEMGEIRMGILGSMSPHFDGKFFTSGSEGVEVVLASGVKFDLGENVAIECGSMYLVVPGIEKKERDLVRFSGGVRIDIGFQFDVQGKRISHADVNLKTPMFAVVDDRLVDSYEGFRSSSIHLDIKIHSPGSNFSFSTSSPMNYLIITPDSLERLRKLFALIQSPLTALVTRRGKLFLPPPPLTSMSSLASFRSSSVSITGSTIRKPKLSRMIGSIRLRVAMYPLVLGFVHELDALLTENKQAALGVRLRAEQMDVDLLLKQRSVQDMMVELGFTEFTGAHHYAAALASVINVPRSAKRWKLVESRIEIAELELRTVTFGNAGADVEASESFSSGRRGNNLSEDVDADGNDLDDDEQTIEEELVTKEWIMDEDFLYVQDPRTEMKMIPFAWAPRAIYFKRRQEDTWTEDLQRSDQDIFGVQISLFRRRLNEILSSINYYQEIQKQLVYRIEVWFDDSLHQQLRIIEEKLQVLFEKKNVIDNYIARCEKTQAEGKRRQKSRSVPSSPNLPDLNQDNTSSLFDHHYIVHNINFLWKTSVRNLVFKLIDLQSKDFALRYFVSNTSIRMVRDLVKAATAHVKPESDLLSPVPEPFDDLESTKTFEPSSYEGTPMRTENLMASSTFTEEDSNQLLEFLLADRKNFVVNHEPIGNLNGSKKSIPEIVINQGENEPLLDLSDAWQSEAFSSNVAYISSSDPKSPDYVPQGYTVESNYVVRLVNPQISLESYPKEDERNLQTVVVAAENMQVQSVHILDDSIQIQSNAVIGDMKGKEESEALGVTATERTRARRLSKVTGEEAKGIAEYYRKQILEDEIIKSERIVKTRTILGINKAQFFVVSKSDIEGSSESDLDNIVMHHRLRPTSPVKNQRADVEALITSSTVAFAPWPVWVPIECLIDSSSHTGHLQRVVEQTSASFHRDKGNPLYVKHSSSSPSATRFGAVKFESTQGDIIHVNFPNFSISVNSTQYGIIFNVINTLLVYRDPARGERLDKLRKVTLALEQMLDLPQVLEKVVGLQESIRNAEALLTYGIHKKQSNAEALANDPARQIELRQNLINKREELYLIMAALKGVKFKNRNPGSTMSSGAAGTPNSAGTANPQASTQVAWRLVAETSQLNWIMLMSDGEKLCKATIDNIAFIWELNEDQSSENRLEVDRFSMENLSSIPNSFRELISPYITEIYDDSKVPLMSSLSPASPIQTVQKRAVDFRLHKMLRVFWRELAPVAGIHVVDHFEVVIAPLFLQTTYEVGRQLILFLFPERAKHTDAAVSNESPTTTGSWVSHSPSTAFADDHGRIKSGLSSSHSMHSLSSEESSMVLDSHIISTHRESFESTPTGRGSLHPMNTAQAKLGKRWAPTTSSDTSSTTRGSARTFQKGRTTNKKHVKNRSVDELRQMQARASENKSFIYIKVPGVQHCLSYRGSKDKNLEDFDKFTFTMPTLEFRNKTWTWYDFWVQVKKGKEKFFKKKAIQSANVPIIRNPQLRHSETFDETASRTSDTFSTTSSTSSIIQEEEVESKENEFTAEQFDERNEGQRTSIFQNMSEKIERYRKKQVFGNQSVPAIQVQSNSSVSFGKPSISTNLMSVNDDDQELLSAGSSETIKKGGGNHGFSGFVKRAASSIRGKARDNNSETASISSDRESIRSVSSNKGTIIHSTSALPPTVTQSLQRENSGVSNAIPVKIDFIISSPELDNYKFDDDSAAIVEKVGDTGLVAVELKSDSASVRSSSSKQKIFGKFR